jgi:C1A family cysteine protease
MFVILLSAPAVCFGIDWDWRAYPGDAVLPAGNYVTPVRDQGNAGTCWAFAATAVIEANYAITYKISNPTIDLSEQNLVCAGNKYGFGTSSGGWEYKAIDYLRDTGIVTEDRMPYTASNNSPYWPLTPPYTLYKITGDLYFLNHSSAENIKNEIMSYGPIVGAIMANTDWYWPANPPLYAGLSDTIESPGGQLGLGLLDPVGSINHTVLFTGFTDDPDAPGGGYFHIKNSWGAAWGQDGYGFVAYATMLQSDHRLSAVNGAAFTLFVPEPSTFMYLVSMFFVMLICVNRGKWKRQ